VAGALELARLAIEQWNAGDLDAVYATWDPGLVVRPDPYFPDSGELVGIAAARRFWEWQRDIMGVGRLVIIEERDAGDRCLMRIRQHVEAPVSGVKDSYEWSFLTTARDGKVVRMEFFIDRDQGLSSASAGAQA
jgi:hypothetical protein